MPVGPARSAGTAFSVAPGTSATANPRAVATVVRADTPGAASRWVEYAGDAGRPLGPTGTVVADTEGLSHRPGDCDYMLRTLERVTIEVTVHLVAGGLLCILASVVGLGGSLPVAAAFALLAAAAFGARERLADVGWVGGFAVGRHLRTAWVAPTLAATTALLGFGTTPGELQALGGLLGLVGMANYFLRPMYLGAYSMALSVLDRVGAGTR